LAIEVRSHDRVTIIDIVGRFDSLTAPAMKSEMAGLIEQGKRRLVINLSKLDFIDSAGLGALVACLRRAVECGGELRLADVPAICRSIFELTRMDRVFDISQSEAAAVESLAEKEPG